MQGIVVVRCLLYFIIKIELTSADERVEHAKDLVGRSLFDIHIII